MLINFFFKKKTAYQLLISDWSSDVCSSDLGTNFVGPMPAYLRSERGLNELCALYGLPPGQPDYDPTREFDATETRYATYAMGDYDIPLGPDISLDGTVGVRVIKTDRTISSYRGEDNGDLTKVTANTSDVDLLPSATARVKFPGGFQARFGDRKSTRPNSSH